MFKDYVQIRVKAGDGGNGAKSFRREKFIPAGGPDGGDGGKGGDVYFRANPHVNTLAEFNFNKLYKAEDGEDGGTNNKTGRSGESIYLDVPVGTIIYEDGQIIADLSEPEEEVALLKGGSGGFGNTRFKTSTKQAPNFAVNGIKTKERTIVLELKMIADVGLVGFPNAGKSTFLSRVTNAKPKIANYPFTTLSPNLGVVEGYGDTFVIADIPGIIEGASEGVGLGDKFLKHIERTRLLVILIDVTSFYGSSQYQLENILKELENYNIDLSKKEKVLVASKMDAKEDAELEFLEEYAKKENLKLFKISSVTGEGLPELLKHLSTRLRTIPKIESDVPIIENKEEVVYRLEKDDETDFDITVEEVTDRKRAKLRGIYTEEDLTYKVYYVTGPAIERLMGRINLSDGESINYLQSMLGKLGVEKELEKLGIKEGDTVDLFGWQFEWC